MGNGQYIMLLAIVFFADLLLGLLVGGLRRKAKEMKKYEFTKEMGEISGFGGGYEDACRAMLRAGLEWWDEHPDANPQYQGYKNIYGIISETNEDAKALSKATVAGAGGDCTGAMHQAVISSIFFIQKHGWEKYVEKMSNRNVGNEGRNAKGE